MTMEEAVETVEAFLEGFKSDVWNPSEIRVHPSGDDKDAIKVFLVFAGTDDESADELKQSASDALQQAHPELGDLHIEFRAIGE